MNIKTYKYDYDCGEASAEFKVDADRFTPEIANATLEFFSWDYDKDEDPVDEVMKKYAIEAIKDATFGGLSVYGVKRAFEEKEGFCRLDDSMGIELIEVTGLEFHDWRLDKLDI